MFDYRVYEKDYKGNIRLDKNRKPIVSNVTIQNQAEEFLDRDWEKEDFDYSDLQKEVDIVIRLLTQNIVIAPLNKSIPLTLDYFEEKFSLVKKWLNSCMHDKLDKYISDYEVTQIVQFIDDYTNNIKQVGYTSNDSELESLKTRTNISIFQIDFTFIKKPWLFEKIYNPTNKIYVYYTFQPRNIEEPKVKTKWPKLLEKTLEKFSAKLVLPNNQEKKKEKPLVENVTATEKKTQGDKATTQVHTLTKSTQSTQSVEQPIKDPTQSTLTLPGSKKNTPRLIFDDLNISSIKVKLIHLQKKPQKVSKTLLIKDWIVELIKLSPDCNVVVQGKQFVHELASIKKQVKVIKLAKSDNFTGFVHGAESVVTIKCHEKQYKLVFSTISYDRGLFIHKGGEPTFQQLRVHASELDIRGYASMNKETLLHAILMRRDVR